MSGNQTTLTSWTASAKPKAHHSPGETVTVMTNRSLTGEVEVAGRLAVGSRIAYNGTSRYTDFYTYERIVPRSDYVMPDWQRILYFVGFRVARQCAPSALCSHEPIVARPWPVSSAVVRNPTRSESNTITAMPRKNRRTAPI